MSFPAGKFGAVVTTVTLTPACTQRRACSYVRVAGALVSGGKLSVRKRIRNGFSDLRGLAKLDQQHDVTARKLLRAVDGALIEGPHLPLRGATAPKHAWFRESSDPS